MVWRVEEPLEGQNPGPSRAAPFPVPANGRMVSRSPCTRGTRRPRTGPRRRRPKKHLRTANAQRAVRADLDALVVRCPRTHCDVTLQAALIQGARSLCALRASPAPPITSSVSDEAGRGTHSGAMARAGLNRESRSSEARFSAVRAMAGSTALAIQPAKLSRPPSALRSVASPRELRVNSGTRASRPTNHEGRHQRAPQATSSHGSAGR